MKPTSWGWLPANDTAPGSASNRMLGSDVPHSSAGPGLKQPGAADGAGANSLDSSTTGDDKNVSILQLQLFCQVT